MRELKQYPSERTLLPDEINRGLGVIAWLLGSVVAIWSADSMAFIPAEWYIAIWSPLYVMVAYAALHTVTGRRWIASEQNGADGK